MSKHSTIVVDYFNFGLIYHLYNIRPRSCVYVLFHSKNRLVEAAICAWMEWRGIKIVFINFYTKSSYRNHTELVDSLTTSFIEEDGSMFIDEKYLYTRVGHIFCVRMYRIASIIEFVRSCDELRKIEHLYVSYPHISKKIIRKLNINDVKFYRSLGREDDFECQNNYRPSQYSSFLLTIKYFFSLVYAFIDFTPRCWPKNLRIKGIFCVHGDTEKERFFFSGFDFEFN